jgi:hypothetical protein
MKKTLSSAIIVAVLCTLIASCSKDDNTSSNTSSNNNSGSTTSPGTATNTQPTGCGTYYPIFNNSYATLIKVGSPASDSTRSTFIGKDTTINGKTYAISRSVTNNKTTTGYTRKDGTKVYVYSAQSPKPFELLILDESKTVGQTWEGGSFSNSSSSGGITSETINTYSLKVVKIHSSLTLGTGLTFNDVFEVNMTLTAETKVNGLTYNKTSYDAGNQFYARCVGPIKTFTPQNPIFGFFNDLTQEVLRYKM